MFFETNSKNESSHTMSFKVCVCYPSQKKQLLLCMGSVQDVALAELVANENHV